MAVAMVVACSHLTDRQVKMAVSKSPRDGHIDGRLDGSLDGLREGRRDSSAAILSTAIPTAQPSCTIRE